MRDIQSILNHLESLFAKQDIEAVEPYLVGELELAFAEKDYGTCITIMNELIGFFRDISAYEKSLSYCEQVLLLMQQLGYEGTLPYATTMLNVANALRASGHLKESLSFYERIFPIYQAHLDVWDERNASLYNNLSLLYQEMGDFEAAAACLKKALEIISYGEDEIKIAITHSNLGASLLKLGKVEEAVAHLKAALQIFNKSKEKDFHYSAAMAAMGQAYVTMERYPEAKECYRTALIEQEKHCGKSEAYYRILDNLKYVEDMLKGSKENGKENIRGHIIGLTLSRMYYEEVAREGLKRAFPEQFHRMAIGLVGEGSECFGFDDKISEDHDFGPGFCIWLTHKDYMEIGDRVQAYYDSLPVTYKGYTRIDVNGQGHGRVGVWDMDRFFKKFVGYSCVEEMDALTAKEKQNALLAIDENGMATILNGAVFGDGLEAFSKRRLAFYHAFTDKIWQFKIARSLILLGQYGQANYPRMMKRGDYITAQMVLYKYVEELLKLVHYINHLFPPYYKWLKRSAATLPKLAVLADLTNAIGDYCDQRSAWKDGDGSRDMICGTIECIAKLILDELTKDGILEGITVTKDELFLEVYGRKMMEKLYEEKAQKEALVDKIVALEWEAFDKVQNIGGRADCQDDWGTFSIMRKSQYLAWTTELLESFINDFEQAGGQGRNLITEKYGRMMASTSPLEYAQLADKLPPMDEAQIAIIEQIAAIQVGWMEEFCQKYPKMAVNCRSIHTAEDTPWNTSYETYLRGELSTYSPRTLKLYGAFIVELMQQKENLARIIMTNTAFLYGYASLEDAESRL